MASITFNSDSGIEIPETSDVRGMTLQQVFKMLFRLIPMILF
jgi:hypothetical protein